MLLLSVVFLPAQTGRERPAKAPDPRVGSLLDQGRLQYDVDEEGDFRVLNQLEEKRSQAVFINSRTNRLYDIEIREIWSAAWSSEKPPDGGVSGKLLMENGRVKIGAWSLQRFGTKFVLVFGAQVPANADLKTLLTVIQTVAVTADDKEKEFAVKDSF